MISKYFEDTYLFRFESELIAHEKEEETDILVFSDTIFYPQGGGQPSDVGSISNGGYSFRVDKVKKIENRILHFGEFINGAAQLGAAQMQIDEKKRISLSKIHTAGHMLDVAMLRLGSKLLPTKGYHFPDSPYVEYAGTIPEEQRADYIANLNTELSTLIAENHSIESHWVKGRKAVSDLCPQVPDYLDFNQDIRIVTVADNLGCPCAGTHVRSTNEIKGIVVKKIKCKKGVTRISYSVLD